MPILMRCTCGKQLRLGDELAGKKVRCPACQAIVAVESAAADAVQAADASKTSSKAKSRPAPEPEEEEEAERIKAEKPRSKAGKKKAPIVDAEDVEEADQDEVEEEDRPRRRKKRPVKQGLSTGAWIGIGAGILVVVLGICGGGIYFLVSGLSGGVDKVRGAAARVQSQNNLKQIGLACINHNDATTQFPTDICDATGKPLLSWRVAILPYVEQQGLYAKFKLNEPWDSANNRPLMEQMPKVFEVPTHPSTNMTHYQRFVGPDTLFPVGKKVRYPGDFTKGTFNSLLVVEAAFPVYWTKPEDIPFNANGDPVAQLDFTDGKCNVLLGDLSVRIISRTIPPQEIKNAVTKNGPPANTGSW